MATFNFGAGTTNYTGEVLEDLLTYTAQENETFKKGLIHIKAGIQKKYTLPSVSLGSIIQDRKPTPVSPTDSQGEYTFAERYLEPNDFMVYLEFNPRDFEQYYKFAQPDGNLVFRTLDPKVQATMLRLLIEGKEEYINSAIWRSAIAESKAKYESSIADTDLALGANQEYGPMKYFDGAITRMMNNINAAPGTEDANSGKVITAGNGAFETGEQVQTELYNMWKKIPYQIRSSEGLTILMDYSTWDKYDEYLSLQLFKNTDNRTENEHRFRGKRVLPLVALPENTIIIGKFTSGRDSNLWMGVDYANDVDVIKIAPLQNNSELYFFKMLMKMDVNIVNPSEIVAHLPFKVAGSSDDDPIVVDKEENGLAWSANTASATVGGSETLPTLTNPNSLDVTYASSDEAVATISDEGAVTIVAAGTTNITASFAGNDTYKSGSVSYALTVSA